MNLQQLIGSELLKNADGSKCSSKDLDLESDGTTVGLYFSAHWCPPCRAFTPQLVEFFNKMNADGKKFRIVFVSLDRDEQKFLEYFKEMPWYAIPYDAEERNTSAENLGVRGIPTLVLFDNSGQKIKTKGDVRTMIMTDMEGKEFPWST